MKRAKRLPANLRAELKALEKLKDSDIDTSDIPEITDADWAKRQSGQFHRPVKKSITIRLDADLVAWFQRKGRGYQTAINRVLREHFASNR